MSSLPTTLDEVRKLFSHAPRLQMLLEGLTEDDTRSFWTIIRQVSTAEFFLKSKHFHPAATTLNPPAHTSVWVIYSDGLSVISAFAVPSSYQEDDFLALILSYIEEEDSDLYITLAQPLSS